VQVQGTAFQTLTDKDGSFRLAGLPAGTYKSGFLSTKRSASQPGTTYKTNDC
jgi:hypothetical protein